MLLVQEYLLNHSFGELAKNFGVYASFSASGHKWSLNYDQLESKETDPLAQECRGLILSTINATNLILHATIKNDKVCYDDIIPGETVVLACPFFRFFNFGMASAANIDFMDSETVIQTKYDGSLIIVYFDPFKNSWCIATRSSPDADILMDNGIYTFRTLFEKAVLDKFECSFSDITGSFNKNKTYCFELMTPYNRIVVDYKNNDVILLGVRDNSSLQEEEPWRHLSNEDDFHIVAKEYKFNKLEDIINYINSQDPSEMEGVVVRDKYFNRVKIKSAAYVLAHKMKDHISSSPRNCLEAILLETDDDMVALLPNEVANNLLEMKEKVKKLIIDYDNYYQILLNCANAINKGDKKTFALMLVKNSTFLWTAPFFQMFDGKAFSMKDFISKNKKNGTWSNSFLDKILEILKSQKT